MSLSWLQLLCFIACFIASFYVLSGMKLSRLFGEQDRSRTILLTFLLSLSLAYLATQAILFLTVYNHL